MHVLRHRITLISFLFLLICSTSQSKAAIVVIYPKVSAPYSDIFSEILSGVEHQYTGEVESKPLSRTQDPDELRQWLDEREPDMLIALGKGGYNLAKSFDKGKSVVVGALPIKPNGISGISLLADPKVLFDALKSLAPNIQKIHVVYSQNSKWLIELAEEQSWAMGLTLNVLEVENLKAATQEYDNLLDIINTQTDAIWLPLDPITTNEQIILPSLLERVWEKNVVLFSSKPAHAKRGALFSMFPNNFELGKQLVVMVESMHQTKEQGGVLPLSSTRLAVNLRTAAHLGFEYKSRQKQQFYLTFPR